MERTICGSNLPLEELHASYAGFLGIYRKVLAEYAEAEQRSRAARQRGKILPDMTVALLPRSSASILAVPEVRPMRGSKIIALVAVGLAPPAFPRKADAITLAAPAKFAALHDDITPVVRVRTRLREGMERLRVAVALPRGTPAAPLSQQPAPALAAAHLVLSALLVIEIGGVGGA